ncbi:primosomal protein DnaI [Brevibacillus sp. SYSU BS000544]|uniref:primosomal protein DnaI n=1 Tax=Brevibacillus sp. SYSU BS000544 TaxID=3416443 RepID=UPI003CE4857D
MEPISQFMGELAKRNPRNLLTPEEQLDKMLRSSAYLKSFQQSHPTLSREDFLRSLSTVYEAVKDQYWCQNCPGLEKCPNLVRGHFARLDVLNNQILSAISPCPKQMAHEEEVKTRRLMRSYYVSEETFSATFETLDIDDVNRQAVAAAMRFCREYEKDTKMKGLYLHGPFGVGKSYLMGAVARELSRRGIASLMVYVPDFIREVKESLADHSYTSKLELLKEIPVLILDDLGAENLTPWIRDEVLGVILHHRVNKNLSTLYTSNYSFDELEDHLSISNGNRIENTKGRRIMERIRHFVDVYLIEGDNRRKQE